MTLHMPRIAVVLTGALLAGLTTTLSIPLTFAEGGARRDVVRQEKQNIKDAVEQATEAVDHGKQGHAEKFVPYADAALQLAMKGGEDPHVTDAIASLKEAIEHGKAGHADMATKHAEIAVTHLSQVR